MNQRVGREQCHHEMAQKKELGAHRETTLILYKHPHHLSASHDNWIRLSIEKWALRAKNAKTYQLVDLPICDE